jgi:5-methyltetrahydrofolate corrinoid/iron sulfur protein methyltransferase
MRLITSEKNHFKQNIQPSPGAPPMTNENETKKNEVTVIGELMNNSYGRARKAWNAREVEGYQHLANLQTALGADYLTLNTDGTQNLSVTLEDMLAFLPKLIPAIQEVTSLPISFDNPHIDFHTAALKVYDRTKCVGRPILNSISVTRQHIDGMIEIASENDMNIIVMSSEYIRPDGRPGAAESVADVLGVTRAFVKKLNLAGIENDRIIVDPGLAPIASDTQGIIHLCLDSIRAIRNDPMLEGVHISVGLSNFAIGTPMHLRMNLERAFLALAVEAGLDWALANPEKNTEPLPLDAPLVLKLREILEAGKPLEKESQEEASYRQLDELMALWADDE